MLQLKAHSAGNNISIIHNMLVESPLTHQKILTVDAKERSNFSWVSAALRAVCGLLIWSSFCRQPGIPQHHGQRQLASEPISVEIPSCFFRPDQCSLSSRTLCSCCIRQEGERHFTCEILIYITITIKSKKQNIVIMFNALLNGLRK